MIKVTLCIKDTEVQLSLEETEKLYKELQKLFPNTAAPVKIHPYSPYRPYWYDKNWDKEYQVSYKIEV